MCTGIVRVGQLDLSGSYMADSTCVTQVRILAAALQPALFALLLCHASSALEQCVGRGGRRVGGSRRAVPEARARPIKALLAPLHFPLRCVPRSSTCPRLVPRQWTPPTPSLLAT